MKEQRQTGGSERRCVLSGATAPRDRMIRFVPAPGGGTVPDLGEKLPGRGFWIRADRAALAEALASGGFHRAASRALKRRVAPSGDDADLPQRIDALLARRVAERLGLERRAGRLVTGYEKVRARLEQGRARVLIEALDGAEDGRRKLRAAAGPEVEIVALLTREQLGLALGRENVVHAAVADGGGARALLREARRLAAWRGAARAGNGAMMRKMEDEVAVVIPAAGDNEEQV